MSADGEYALSSYGDDRFAGSPRNPGALGGQKLGGMSAAHRGRPGTVSPSERALAAHRPAAAMVAWARWVGVSRQAIHGEITGVPNTRNEYMEGRRRGGVADSALSLRVQTATRAKALMCVGGSAGGHAEAHERMEVAGHGAAVRCGVHRIDGARRDVWDAGESSQRFTRLALRISQARRLSSRPHGTCCRVPRPALA